MREDYIRVMCLVGKCESYVRVIQEFSYVGTVIETVSKIC